MVQTRHGAVLDRKGQDGLGIQSKSERQRGPDRAPMRDRHDVTAPELLREALHGRPDARTHVSKALAPRRALVGGRIPVACRQRGPLGRKAGAIETLPRAQMLLGQGRNRPKGWGGFVLLEVSAAPERLGGVAG